MTSLGVARQLLCETQTKNILLDPRLLANYWLVLLANYIYGHKKILKLKFLKVCLEQLCSRRY